MATFRLDGLSEAVGKLNSAPAALQAGARQVLAMTAARTARDTQLNITRMGAVDTGFLRGSIDYSSGASEATVTAQAEYGIYVHDGTSRMPGRPFLSTAAEANEDIFRQALEVVVTRHFGGR